MLTATYRVSHSQIQNAVSKRVLRDSKIIKDLKESNLAVEIGPGPMGSKLHPLNEEETIQEVSDYHMSHGRPYLRIATIGTHLQRKKLQRAAVGAIRRSIKSRRSNPTKIYEEIGMQCVRSVRYGLRTHRLNLKELAPKTLEDRVKRGVSRANPLFDTGTLAKAVSYKVTRK